MSKTIDQKVVEMRFDNRHFESNVRSTMSTLDKLKAKLNFKDSAKGLNELTTASNKVNMNGLTSAVNTVSSRFSAMEVIGVTALANITNSAVNAGKRILNSLTLEPVTTGFREYELKMDSIKTIMASTGESVDTVNKYLNELNEYSDQTIYSFADMTQNIGKFTNAGVKLEDAVMAIKGISNEAAVSGANANEASRAMYNFAQALSAGYVKLIDWKSIENANMATVEFKQQLIDSAVAMGTLTKTSDGMYKTLSGDTLSATKNFNETLQEQWMTTEVLVDTLKDYADSSTDIGKKAFAAAQDVTKFSQVLDILKETAQSGWARTWEIIFGNIEQAKALFTPLTNFFSDIIDGISDFRNGILELALGSPLAKLGKKFNEIAEPIKNTVDTIRMSVEELDKMANQVIRGNWGNGKARFDALTKAGYNHYAIQNRVNEKLGDGFRHSEELIESQYRLLGATEKTTEAEKKSIKSKEDLLIHLAKLSDAELEATLENKKQVEAIKELRKYSKMTGLSIEELVKNLDDFSGRWLLIRSFKNIGQGLVSVFRAVGNAWRETFFGEANNETIMGKLANGLFRVIAAFHKFTTYLTVSERAQENLKDTFKGLFSFLNLFLTIIGGPIKIGLKILGQLFKALDISAAGVLEFTGALGRGISNFNNWLNSLIDFSAIFEFLAPYIKKAASAVTEWFKSLKLSNRLEGFINQLKRMRDALKNWILGIKDAENIPKYIFEGLVNGLKKGIGAVVKTVINIGKKIIEGICKVLGIESPSKEFFKIGKYIIEGLINGVKDGAKSLWNFIKGVGLKCIEVFNKIDFGKLLAAGIGIGMLVVITKLLNVINAFTAPLEGFANMMEDVGKGVKAFGQGVKKWGQAKLIKSIAESIAILVIAVIALTFVDPAELKMALAAIVVLAAVIGVLAFVCGKAKDIKDVGKLSTIILGISAALLLTAMAFQKLASVDPDRMLSTIGAFAAIIVGLVALVAVLGLIANSKASKNIDKAGIMMAKIAGSLIIMGIAIKLIAGIDAGDIAKGLIVIGLLGILYAVLITMSKNSGAHADKAGKMLSKMAFALLLSILVIKLASRLDGEEVAKGIGVMTALGLFFGLIIGVSKRAGKNVAKVGTMMILMAGALAITVGVIKMIDKLNGKQLIKGVAVIMALGAVAAALVAVSKFSGKNAIKAGTMVLMISSALLIITGVLFLLSKMEGKGLAKALGVVTVLEALFAGLIAVTKFSKNCMSTIIAMTVTLGVLIAAVIGLTFIDPGKLASATASISIIMGALALLIASTKLLKNSKNNLKTFGELLLLVAALAGIVVLLSKANPESAIPSAIALTILSGALSGILAALKFVGKVSIKDMATGIGGLLGLCVVLVALVGILKLMDGVKNATQSATVLGVFVGVLSVVLLLTAAVGAIYMATGFIAMLGLVGLLAVVAALAAVIGVLYLMSGVKNAIANLEALQKFLIVMTAVLVVLAIVGPLALTGVVAMYALTALMVIIGTLAVAIGALMDKFPALQDFLDKGLPVLIQLAGGIGQMVGAFVGGIMTQIASKLPYIGLMLSQFMVNSMPFIKGAKKVNKKVISGVGSLAAAILVLTAADFISSVASFLTGGDSFAELGKDLSDFMVNAMPFLIASMAIRPEMVNGVKTLSEAILTITKANLVQGITSFLTGNSLEDFGEDLVSLAEYLTSFADSLKSFDKKKSDKVQLAAQCLSALAKAASEIPNTGGLLGAIVGDNDMSDFADQFGALGTGLSEFVKNIGDFTSDNLDTVKLAAEAVKALATVAKEIPNTGGLLGLLVGNNDLGTFANDFPLLGSGLRGFLDNIVSFSKKNLDTVKLAAEAVKSLATVSNEIPNMGGALAAIIGDNTLGTFAEQFPILGSGLKGFMDNVGVFDDDQIKTIKAAADAVVILATASGKIPNMGGALAKIVGDNDLGTFAEQFPKLGSGLKGFASKLGVFSEDQINTVYCAVRAVEVISKLGQINMTAVGTGLAGFGKNMIDFGKHLKTFITNIEAVAADKVDTAMSKISQLITMARTIDSIDANSLTEFGEGLKNVAKEGVVGFVAEIEGTEPKKDAERAAKALMASVVDGLENKRSSIKEKAISLAGEATDNLYDKTIETNAKTAGQDLATGFANGIKSDASIKQVSAAGTTIGKKALEAAKKAIDSNSPSKEAMKIGNYFGQGLAIGINDYGNETYKASYNIADRARDGLGRAISKITKMFSNDMDTQPTIRPVLDLSEVESGAGYLNTLFNNQSIGVNTNLRAISSNMNSRSQNGANSEVVSAINKLRKDLGNVSGDTYNINGVAYADTDTDINNAVQTLVRAAKVERRV